MKRLFNILVLLSICYQSYAQMGEYFNLGKVGETYLSEAPQEFVQAYYYDESNTVQVRRVLLCRINYVGGGGRASIWVCEDKDVKIDSKGRFHLYGGYGVSNISRCNKKEPVNKLEQSFSYKYLDNGTWYYFNTGLDLFLEPEKKSFIEKFKELLFK